MGKSKLHEAWGRLLTSFKKPGKPSTPAGIMDGPPEPCCQAQRAGCAPALPAGPILPSTPSTQSLSQPSPTSGLCGLRTTRPFQNPDNAEGTCGSCDTSTSTTQLPSAVYASAPGGCQQQLATASQPYISGATMFDGPSSMSFNTLRPLASPRPSMKSSFGRHSRPQGSSDAGTSSLWASSNGRVSSNGLVILNTSASNNINKIAEEVSENPNIVQRDSLSSTSSGSSDDLLDAQGHLNYWSDDILPAASAPQLLCPAVLRLLASQDCLLHIAPQIPRQMRRSVWRLGDYQLVRKLYKGYSSSVYKAICTHSRVPVCLKVYNVDAMSPFLKHQVYREVEVHRNLQHRNIIALHGVFLEQCYLVLVQEYARGGDLHHITKRLGGHVPERQCVETVLQPLMSAMTYIHSRGIVHRDIKPENIMFTENWELKLGDFGVSINCRSERPVTRTGTADYMAPEIKACPLKRKPQDNKDNMQLGYGHAADVWSIGSMTYELLVGFSPNLSQLHQVASIQLASRAGGAAPLKEPAQVGGPTPFGGEAAQAAATAAASSHSSGDDAARTAGASNAQRASPVPSAGNCPVMHLTGGAADALDGSIAQSLLPAALFISAASISTCSHNAAQQTHDVSSLTAASACTGRPRAVDVSMILINNTGGSEPAAPATDADGAAVAAPAPPSRASSSTMEAARNSSPLPKARFVTLPPQEGIARAAAPQMQPSTTLPFPSSISPAARDFIAAALRPHPADRPTALELSMHDLLVSMRRNASYPCVQSVAC